MAKTSDHLEFSKEVYSKLESREVKSEINNATVINKDGTVTNHIPMGGKLAESWTRKNSYTMRAQLNFNRQFAELHDVQAIAGAERRKVTADGTKVNKWGYDDTTLAFKYINELNLGQTQPATGFQPADRNGMQADRQGHLGNIPRLCDRI